jgi:hypothetical protein
MQILARGRWRDVRQVVGLQNRLREQRMRMPARCGPVVRSQPLRLSVCT